jgi:hypothetical protein
MTTSSDELAQELEEARSRAQKLVQGLTPDELTRRVDPAKWSIAECIAHLNVTASVVQPLISKAIAHGRKKSLLGKGPFPLGARGRLLIWIATPPPKFRIPAPKSVVPPVTIPNPGHVLEDFMKAQDNWERLWREADGLDLARINIGPRLSAFHCHVSASFPWMMAHQRRHLLQAENVKQQMVTAASSAPA